MSKSLENLLEEYNSENPITDDESLVRALSHIIDAESAKEPCDMDTDLIDEAVSFLTSITSPGYDADADARRVCEASMRSLRTTEKRRTPWQRFIKGFKMAQGRVAVLAATVTAVAVIFVGINGGVAASVLDSVISYFRSVAVITPAETSPESEVLEFASPPEAPDGFCVTEEKTEEETYFIRYKNTVGDFIIVEVRPTNPSGVIHGTDGNTYGEVKIGDFTGYMFYSEGERKGSVIFGDAKTTVTVSGICDSDVLLQLARELVE